MKNLTFLLAETYTYEVDKTPGFVYGIWGFMTVAMLLVGIYVIKATLKSIKRRNDAETGDSWVHTEAVLQDIKSVRHHTSNNHHTSHYGIYTYSANGQTLKYNHNIGFRNKKDVPETVKIAYLFSDPTETVSLERKSGHSVGIFVGVLFCLFAGLSLFSLITDIISNM